MSQPYVTPRQISGSQRDALVTECLVVSPTPGVEALSTDLNGAVSVANGLKSTSPSAGIGYATGAGGVVTQITSITTAVTLDKVCGTITTFSAAAVAGAEDGPFTVNNAQVAATDVVLVSIKSYAGTGTPQVYVSAVAAGSFAVTITNLAGAAALNAPIVFNFVVIKGVAA